jgi:hypothetical protein
MYSGQALFQSIGGADRSSFLMLTTFYLCGVDPIDKGTAQTVGTVWLAMTNGATRFSVQNANWTANQVTPHNTNNAPGSVFACDNGGLSSLSFLYVTCLNNKGSTTIYYTSSGQVSEQNRPPFRFEYVNFVGGSSQYHSEQVISVQNVNILVYRCVFRSNTYNQLFSFSTYTTVNVTECVWDNAPGTIGGSAVTSGNRQATTATYDPDCPVSVCIVPPGTTPFSPSNPFKQTGGFANSAEWTNSSPVQPSLAPLASRAIPPSAGFAGSRSLVTDGFAPSNPIAESANLRESAGFSRSIAPGETQLFQASGQHQETRLIETGNFEATEPNAASQGFSPTHSFTERKSPYPARQSLIEMSGYIFFLFFAGDTA